MEAKNQILINKSLEKTLTCKTILEQIASTCCMPIRSKKMLDSFDSLDNLRSQLASKNMESFSASIGEIELCGGQIGKLYVSCCTVKREPLYQQLLKNLNDIHTNVHRVMGTSH